MLLPKKDLIQVEYGKLIIIMRISIYLLITTPTSHTHLLLTTPTSHTHRFHPLSKIVIHNSAHPYCTEVWITILESGWNLWVWLVGVVSRRWVWLVGVVIRRYIDILIIIINFPYSTCIRSFFGSSILTSLFIFKCFFGLVSVIFLQYIANVTHRTFEIVQKKSRSREYKNYLNERRTCVDGARARARVPRLPRARYGIRSE